MTREASKNYLCHMVVSLDFANRLYVVGIFNRMLEVTPDSKWPRRICSEAIEWPGKVDTKK